MQIPFHIEDLRVSLADSSREAEFLQELGSSYRDIYVSVLAIVGNRTDTEDVVQDVCVILWQRFDEFESGTSFRKWACAFAFNVAKDYVRHQRRRRGFGLSDHILTMIARHQTAGSELFELRQEVLEKCLTKLRSKDHRFLMNCYERKTTLGEYARLENIPVTSVYTRLARLRKQIVGCVQRSLGRDDEFQIE